MSGIQGLSSDQQQVYNQLINDAGTVNVSRAAVDKELQVAMDAGLSFQEAAAQVRNDLPTLTPPKSSSGALGAWVGVASPMASINALITEMSAEQRKENREAARLRRRVRGDQHRHGRCPVRHGHEAVEHGQAAGGAG